MTASHKQKRPNDSIKQCVQSALLCPFINFLKEKSEALETARRVGGKVFLQKLIDRKYHDSGG